MSEETEDKKQLTTSETITAMAHYYRAEVVRSLTWRQRIDVTTNWAVGATAAFLGFSFTNANLTHGFFIFALAITYILLYVESRRYRFYDAYEYRVKLIHQNFVFNILHGYMDTGPYAAWREALAQDILHPEYKISMLEAMALRIRAYYIFLFLVLIASWLVKIMLHPKTAETWAQYLEQARFGNFSGGWTLGFIALFVIHLFVLRFMGQRLKMKGGRDIVHAWPKGDHRREEKSPVSTAPPSGGSGWPTNPED
ncbi:MAG: DUF2270 domain-containing protein [Deltaproteobacteria bacterium]|nr:DUF2270 domain-containing protein [Deltaproteobacteria bacterium]